MSELRTPTDVDASWQTDVAVDQADGGSNARVEAVGLTVLPDRRWVVALVAAVAIVRYLFSANRVVFSVAPDEMATVGMARFLSGGDWNMLVANVYRPGLATILTPVFALVDDQVWLIRAGLMINALIAGISVFWLVRLVARLTPLSHRAVLAVSAAIALMPSSLVASAHLWAEPLVSLSFMATLLALLRFFDTGSYRFGVPAVLWPVFGYVAHGRLLPLILLAAVAVGIGAIRHNRVHVGVVCGALALAAGFAASVYTRWIVDQVWEHPGSANTSGGVLERLSDPLQVLDSAVGQVWYQLCASALVFGFGMVVLARRCGKGQSARVRTDALIVLSLTAPLMMVSMVFMSDRARPDHVIYGRYNDAIVWPVLAVGAGWLFSERFAERGRRSRWMFAGVVAVTVELALMLRQLHHLQLGERAVRPMISGVVVATGNETISVFAVTAAALAALGVLTVAAAQRARPWLLASLVVVLVAVAGVRTWRIFYSLGNSWENTSAVREIDDLGLDLSEPLGVSLMPDVYGPDVTAGGQVMIALSYQWYLPNHQFVLDNGPSDSVGPYVFAVTNDALLIRDGGTIVWQDPNRRVALWREPVVDD